MEPTISQEEIGRIVAGDHHDPFEVLGKHPVWRQAGQVMAVRAFLPDAESVRVVMIPPDRGLHGMSKLHPAGFFEAVLPAADGGSDYQLEATYPGGVTRRIHDPYSF